MESNLSLSDIAAVTNNEGFCGGNSWILILLFAMIYGGGFFGNRTGEFGQYATAASQQEILFGQQFQGLDNKIDRLGNGIADATFSLNNSITSEGRNLQQQIADCCCSNKEAIAQVRYDMATLNASTAAAIHAEGEATRNMLQQNKIETLQSQLNSVQMQQAIQNAMCGIPKINPYMYNITPNCNCNCTGLTTI